MSEELKVAGYRKLLHSIFDLEDGDVVHLALHSDIVDDATFRVLQRREKELIPKRFSVGLIVE